MKNGITIVALVWCVLAIVGAYGWIMNIVSLVGSNFDPITGLVIARIIGVFVGPLGVVLGFI